MAIHPSLNPSHGVPAAAPAPAPAPGGGRREEVARDVAAVGPRSGAGEGGGQTEKQQAVSLSLNSQERLERAFVSFTTRCLLDCGPFSRSVFVLFLELLALSLSSACRRRYEHVSVSVLWSRTVFQNAFRFFVSFKTEVLLLFLCVCVRVCVCVLF